MHEVVTRVEFEDQLNVLRRRLDRIEALANASSVASSQASRLVEVLSFDLRTLWRVVATTVSDEQRELLRRELQAGVVGMAVSDESVVEQVAVGRDR